MSKQLNIVDKTVDTFKSAVQVLLKRAYSNETLSEFYQSRDVGKTIRFRGVEKVFFEYFAKSFIHDIMDMYNGTDFDMSGLEHKQVCEAIAARAEEFEKPVVLFIIHVIKSQPESYPVKLTYTYNVGKYMNSLIEHEEDKCNDWIILYTSMILNTFISYFAHIMSKLMQGANITVNLDVLISILMIIGEEAPGYHDVFVDLQQAIEDSNARPKLKTKTKTKSKDKGKRVTTLEPAEDVVSTKSKRSRRSRKDSETLKTPELPVEVKEEEASEEPENVSRRSRRQARSERRRRRQKEPEEDSIFSDSEEEVKRGKGRSRRRRKNLAEIEGSADESP